MVTQFTDIYVSFGFSVLIIWSLEEACDIFLFIVVYIDWFVYFLLLICLFLFFIIICLQHTRVYKEQNGNLHHVSYGSLHAIITADI